MFTLQWQLQEKQDDDIFFACGVGVDA